ncbi:hypothetical protein LINGRAHAP2_LOCUS11297 [Linum grandiflorum]
MDVERRPWADLPGEILSLILERLFGKDIVIFLAVCSHWRRTPPPRVKQIDAPLSEIIKHPFSIHSYSQLYSPAYNKTYAVDDSSILALDLLMLKYTLPTMDGCFCLEVLASSSSILPRETSSACLPYPQMSWGTFKWCCSSSPVFHNGAFYCLSKNGMLGVFDPNKNKKRMWRLLNAGGLHHKAFVADVLDEPYLVE